MGAGAKPTGFVGEMRKVAMKLHTKDQAPKEGKKDAPEEKKMAQWQPTREGYLQFLVDSKAVYDTIESITGDAVDDSLYMPFRDTGLERGEALAKDIEWFKAEYDLEAPVAGEAGEEYAKYLRQLATTNPPAFICHFYNIYFAHTAGGMMIGKKVSDMVLDGKALEFYKWESELGTLLDAVRDSLNLVAESWDEEQKKVCLEETELSFKYSGAILRVLAQ